MPTFDAPDGTVLAYHHLGAGDRPLICVPGGPMIASAYLGTMGGVSPLVTLDLRGTGDSAAPADPASFRVDRQIQDVEALRTELGLEEFDLAAHSAGATLALLYAARFPARVDRLVLIAPSPLVVGLEISDEDRREVARPRRDELPDAYAALERIWAGTATVADWEAMAPLTYGRWDAAASAQEALQTSLRNDEAAAAYYSPEAFDPPAVRAALATLPARVLLIAGERDVALPAKRAAEYAGLFRDARLAVTPGGGHSPWLEDPAWFVATVTDFLGR